MSVLLFFSTSDFPSLYLSGPFRSHFLCSFFSSSLLLDQSISLAAACAWLGATASGDSVRFGTLLLHHLAHFFDTETNGFEIFSGLRGSTLRFNFLFFVYSAGRLRLCRCRCMLS
jgi:hypothetical protein